MSARPSQGTDPPMGASAYEAVFSRIQGLIVTRDLDVLSDDDEVRRIVETEIERFQRSSASGAEVGEAFANPDDVRSRMVSDLGGFSALGELIVDPDVEEVYGSDGDLIYRATNGETRAVATPANPTAVLNLLQRLVAAAGEQLDASHPKVHGIRVMLPNGRPGRLTASIPPRVEGVVSFTLRIPQKRHATLEDLVVFGSLTAAAARFLTVLMWALRVKVLVAGPPNSGKTTMCDGLLRAVPARRKTIVAEENRELTAPLLKGEYWQTSRVESLRDLLRSARVASPDLLVLGELKGEEAWELAMAANIGCGVVAAVHADSASMAFESLAVAANPAVPAMRSDELRTLFYRMFDVVVFLDMDDDGDQALRQVTEISVVPPQQSSLAVALTPIFARADIGEPMELVNSSLGDELTRKCNRVLRRHKTTITEILQGAEVDW
jgi:pilus assembly protein CpaF